MVMSGDGQISVSLAMCMVLGGRWRFFEDKNKKLSSSATRNFE
jgi:hypothetical protein